jgi:hypothetical protein
MFTFFHGVMALGQISGKKKQGTTLFFLIGTTVVIRFQLRGDAARR